MATKTTCSMVTADNGKPSILHKELRKAVGNDRPTANLVWCMYKANDVASKMDALGYKRDANGEHSAKDVMDVLKVNSIITSMSSNTASVAQAAGVMNADGTPVEFSNANDALTKAININNTNPGKVAYTIQVGDKFRVTVETRNSSNQRTVVRMQTAMDAWVNTVNYMESKGLSIRDLATEMPDVVNATNMVGVRQLFRNISTGSLSSLTVDNLKALIILSQTNATVANLINAGHAGSIHQAAVDLYELIQHPTTTRLSASYQLLLNNSLNIMRNALASEMNDISQISIDAIDNNESSYEGNIAQSIDKANVKFGINEEAIVIKSNEIKSLEDAAYQAMYTLQRQLRILKEEGKASSSRASATERAIQQLEADIAAKKYYAGIMNTLSQAYSDLQTIKASLTSIPTTGDFFKDAQARAKEFIRINRMIAAYKNIAESCTYIDNLTITENISSADKAAIEKVSKDILDILNKNNKAILSLQTDTLIDIASLTFGDKYNPEDIKNWILMADSDTSTMDLLYSMSRTSSTQINVMGGLVERVHSDRDKKLNAYKKQVNRITEELFASGEKNTDFMYNPDGTIVYEYDIDYKEYNKQRFKEMMRLRNNGVSGISLQMAMEQWEEDNTREIPVDVDASGNVVRTERIPDYAFSSPSAAFANLTPAQYKYWKAIMQIKGEIGTVLPEYAQHWLLPAQIRNSNLDVISDLTHGKISLRNAVHILLDRAKFWKIREDDRDFIQNGDVIDERDMYAIAKTDYDNKIRRRIPIFNINKIKNQKELLKDFSAGIDALASTAFNYEAMHSIEEILLTMADYIGGEHNQPVQKDGHGNKYVDAIRVADRYCLKWITSQTGNGNTKAFLDDMIAKQVYGKNLNTNGTWTQIAKSLLQFTSIIRLTANVPGAVANWSVGELQNVMEALSGGLKGGTRFNITDLAVGYGALWSHTGHEVMELLTNNKNSLAYLLREEFDPMQDNYEDATYSRYHSNIFRQLFGGFNAFGGYAVGEYLIHYVVMYAMLNHEKVSKFNPKTGKYEQVSLLSVLKTGNKVSKNSELIIDGDVLDPNGQPLTLDSEYIRRVKGKIKTANQENHGSMNTEDKGLIHQYLLGRVFMQLRQWMVEHYSKRFRMRHYDASSNTFKRGYYAEAYMLLKDSLSDGFKNFRTNLVINYNNLSEEDKQQIRRCLSELSVLTILMTINGFAGDPDKYKGEYWKRFFLYQSMRAEADVMASVPFGVAKEMRNISKSPGAVFNTVSALSYPFTGWMDDGWDVVKKGRHRGENKYFYKCKKYSLPFYNQIDQLMNIGEEDYIFSVFDGSKSM